MFGHLVVSEAKDELIKNMSVFQTAKPGHRCQENLFILKSMMAINEKHDEVLIAQSMDLEKFFDKEQLLDVLNDAHKKQSER